MGQEDHAFESDTWSPVTFGPRKSKLTNTPSSLISTYNEMKPKKENLFRKVLSVLIQFQRLQKNLPKSYRVIKAIALRKRSNIKHSKWCLPHRSTLGWWNSVLKWQRFKSMPKIHFHLYKKSSKNIKRMFTPSQLDCNISKTYNGVSKSSLMRKPEIELFWNMHMVLIYPWIHKIF